LLFRFRQKSRQQPLLASAKYLATLKCLPWHTHCTSSARNVISARNAMSLREHTHDIPGFATMWMIDGPQGMPVTEAKRRLRLRPGPLDVVIYREASDAASPRIVSRHPIMPGEVARALRC
jgi:hypothetical protein